MYACSQATHFLCKAFFPCNPRFYSHTHGCECLWFPAAQALTCWTRQSAACTTRCVCSARPWPTPVWSSAVGSRRCRRVPPHASCQQLCVLHQSALCAAHCGCRCPHTRLSVPGHRKPDDRSLHAGKPAVCQTPVGCPMTRSHCGRSRTVLSFRRLSFHAVHHAPLSSVNRPRPCSRVDTSNLEGVV